MFDFYEADMLSKRIQQAVQLSRCQARIPRGERISVRDSRLVHSRQVSAEAAQVALRRARLMYQHQQR